ncbi:Cytoskeletal protein RodZ [Commensalibacter communis]|uniref:helix-turn-helix domain-containing protein n=1 Tax=Commensalibacter communis TaxID=2972786 RepID=UPI0022FF962D|nr:helix-turn-helix domain-containing protein [Commensalibacter communis]CAI3956776.1 Cytoskeletal protein RodZ [Commensalibacter communis]CAI3957345.1 Cytoskeletal protein RodZ [Commensalibacter communis]
MSDLNQLYSDKNIGEILKTRREEQGLSLEEVSQRLRIRLVFLKALEDGRIDQLPGIAYASGFLRAYAELLNLDSDVLVKQFRQENKGNSEKQQLMFPAPVPQSGVPAAVIVFVSLIIMVGAYIGWYKMSDHHQAPPEVIPSPPTQAEQNSGTTQQISPQIASIMPTDHPAPLSQDNQHAEANPASNAPVTNQQPATALPQQLQQPTEPTSSPPPAPNNKDVAAAEAKQPEQPLMIKAIAPSWLQIKDKEGHVLYQKVLKTDETWQVPSDKDEVIMTIGNPGVVVLQKGELQSSPLGKKGKTLRRFVLDLSKIDKLLHPSDKKIADKPVSNNVVTRNKKPVVSKPATRSNHDVSADDLNAKQLNR